MRTYLSVRDCRSLLALTNLIYTLPGREEVLATVTETLKSLVPYSSIVYLAMDRTGFRREGHFLQGQTEKALSAFTAHYAAVHPFTQTGWVHHANAAARITDFVPAYRLPDTEYGREFLRMTEISWETGVVLQAQGDPVGALCLHRQKPNRDFTDRELLIIDALAPHLARVLNHFDLLEEIRSGQISSDAGIFSVGPDGEMKINAVAAKLLKENPQLLTSGIPASSGSEVLRISGTPYRVRTTLEAPERGRMILFEPLLHAETVLHSLSSWNLTDRQREVVLMVVRGATNREIAESLSVTEQTVKDHLKAIYDKAGIRSRTKLTARILSDKEDHG
ncbi:MAG: LuxR C-terminal-related transcriptional regulator [Nitrospirae bacterium]|nr:LuxR C-terminal-related transcriptional regulator [Nitrospirota bacterium]